MSNKTSWIQCRVSPGMFSSERTVELGSRSFFVEERSVRNVRADGYGEIEVQILPQRDGRDLAVLPTEAKDLFFLQA